MDGGQADISPEALEQAFAEALGLKTGSALGPLERSFLTQSADDYDAGEAPGLDVICRGLSMVLDDPQVVTVAGAIFDGLYEHRRRALLLGREPA